MQDLAERPFSDLFRCLSSVRRAWVGTQGTARKSVLAFFEWKFISPDNSLTVSLYMSLNLGGDIEMFNTHWLREHPSTASSKCLTMGHDNDGNSGWGERDCQGKLPFVCETRTSNN